MTGRAKHGRKNWLDAVKRDGMILKDIPEEEQAEEICIAAIEQNIQAFSYVKKQTVNICLEAYEKCPFYVMGKTDMDVLTQIKTMTKWRDEHGKAKRRRV